MTREELFRMYDEVLAQEGWQIRQGARDDFGVITPGGTRIAIPFETVSDAIQHILTRTRPTWLAMKAEGLQW